MSKVLVILKANVLYTVLASLMIGDGIITNILIKSGIGSEGNTFIGFQAGSWSLIWIKLLGVFVVIYFLWKISQKHPKLAKYTTIGCITFYGLVLTWNLLIVLLRV